MRQRTHSHNRCALSQLVLSKTLEASVIGALLIFNAALGYFQESRAQATLAGLKPRQAQSASVRRNGDWRTLPADLVPPHVVKLSVGRVVPGDARLISGAALLWILKAALKRADKRHQVDELKLAA